MKQYCSTRWLLVPWRYSVVIDYIDDLLFLTANIEGGLSKLGNASAVRRFSENNLGFTFKLTQLIQYYWSRNCNCSKIPKPILKVQEKVKSALPQPQPFRKWAGEILPVKFKEPYLDDCWVLARKALTSFWIWKIWKIQTMFCLSPF